VSQLNTHHTLKERLRVIVFGIDTPAGMLFDRALIVIILLSLLVVILDSIQAISTQFHVELSWFEWLFTFLFSVEYVVRVYCAKHRWAYIKSFFGIIDLLSVLPTYLALLFPDLHALLDVRILRLIRVFRIFKLTQYMSEYQHLANALAASKRKIFVFLSVVLMVVMVMGTLMYVVEGPSNGFTSIPLGIYWAITTMTTVGFGDITPQTDFGKLIASVMMLMGWGTLAVPTGIVTAEMTYIGRKNFKESQACDECGRGGFNAGDRFCSSCGSPLPSKTS
jgi:voltage-gated potassium channel